MRTASTLAYFRSVFFSLFYRNSAPPDQSTSNNSNRNRTRNFKNNNNNNRRGNGPKNFRSGQAALKLENPFRVQRIVAAPPPPRRERRDNNNNNNRERRPRREVASGSTDSKGKTETRTSSPSEFGGVSSRGNGRGRCDSEVASEDIL